MVWLAPGNWCRLNWRGSIVRDRVRGSARAKAGAEEGPQGALLNFRPVLRNTSALAYFIGYMVHTSATLALRSWVFTFLTFTAFGTGSCGGIFTPAIIAMCLSLVGTVTSVAGNEAARRLGRGRDITCVMTVSIGLAFGISFSSGGSYGLAAALCLVCAGLIWPDT